MKGEFYDLVVVGSAFGGSLLAMIARRLGCSVLLVERDRHPRFAIGESSTPLTNLLLEELTTQYNLPRVKAFTKWGSWQRAHPQVTAGLKRGFSFYHHLPGQTWKKRLDRSNELLVSASPNDEVADTHWYRPDFDAFLMQEAVFLGVDYSDETRLTEFSEGADGVRIAGTRRGEPVQFRGRFLVDASGARGFLWQRLRLGEIPFGSYPETESLFSHFNGVERWETVMGEEATSGGSRRNATEKPSPIPPFPPDDSALHHLFPGGWMWVLRFNNGLTSAGVSVSRQLGRELQLSAGAGAWNRVLQRLPSVARQFREARPVRNFTHAYPVAFCSRVMVGNSWAMLPSAAGFVDPLLSTGFPLTLMGIQHLAALLAPGKTPLRSGLDNYEASTRADFEVVANLIGTLHLNLGRPAIFQALTMFYFAAATFSETTRRLDRSQRSPGFLLRGRPDFRQALEDLCAQARRPVLAEAEFRRSVARAIKPVNVAGLIDSRRRNWYPVDLSDLFQSRDKLGADDQEIRAMLSASGIALPER